MEPISAALTSIAILGNGFVNAIGPRIAQKLFPTPFDQAQIVAIETQRQRLIDEESRFQRQIAESRVRLLQELTHRKDMVELQEQLRRWQFDFLPAAFINMSQSAGGTALNIILRISDHRRSPGGKSDVEAIMLKDAMMAAEEQIIALYSAESLFPYGSIIGPRNGVFFYADYNLRRELPIQSAVTTLSTLLSSEPVVLIDIAIRDRQRYRVTVSHWGDAMGDAPQPVTLPSKTLDLSAFTNDQQQAAGALSVSLISLLVAISDGFHMLRHSWATPQPALPSILSYLRRTSGLAIDWEALYAIYQKSIEITASRSPNIAIELCAHFAIAAQRIGEKDVANMALEQAQRIFCGLYRQISDPQQIVTRLVASSLQHHYPQLLSALKVIADVSPQTTSVRSKEDTYALLSQSVHGSDELKSGGDKLNR